MNMTIKRPGRWNCPYPVGAEYSFKYLRFPWCLRVWLLRMPLWATVLHVLGHFGLDVWEANEKLLRLGLLYAEQDGGILRWQWRFWRGSYLARMLQAVDEGMTPRQAQLMYGKDPYRRT